MRPSPFFDFFLALKQLAEKEGGEILEIGSELYISFREPKQVFMKIVGDDIYLTTGGTTVSTRVTGIVLKCSGKVTVEVDNPSVVVIATRAHSISLNGNKLQFD